MAWIDGEVDGMPVKVRSIVGSAEFCNVFEQFMEYELMRLTDRENMSTGFGDPFNDTSDVTLSNAYLSSGALQNTVIAAVPSRTEGYPLVPLMTAATTNGYTASSSGDYSSGYDAWHAFRGATGWDEGWVGTNGLSANIWLRIEIPSALAVNSYMLMSVPGTTECNPGSWYFQGSNDGSTWTTLDTRTGYTWTSNQVRTFTFNNSIAYKYYRLYITANTGGSYTEVQQLQLYAIKNYVMPVMSSSSQSGYIVSASSTYYTGGFPPYMAFNRVASYNNYNSWSANSGDTAGWLQVQLPAARIVTSYDLQADGSYPQNMPNTWTLQGSDNGSTWTTLDSRSGVTYTAYETKTFTFTNTVSYLYYRLKASSIASGGYIIISEMQLYYEPVAGESLAAAVTMDSYVPTETLEAIKVKLWLEDLDNTGAISCGNTGSDKIEAYLSYDGNSTFTSALSFLTDDIKAAYTGSNIYIFTSEEIDVSAETITGLGLKVQSFARSVAPNFKLHGTLVVGRPVTEE